MKIVSFIFGFLLATAIMYWFNPFQDKPDDNNCREQLCREYSADDINSTLTAAIIQKMSEAYAKEGKEGNMPQMDKITQGQQKMNEAMKESLGKMKKGEKPGSEGFGGMAAEQAKVRKALQDIDSKMKQNGQGKKEIQDIIDAMDQIEKDLVNKRLTNEMITRQEQIMVRLLEEERAQRSQEQDEKRKASQAIQQQSKVPASMQEYIKKREANIDEFRPVYPALTPYYKRLVEQYYNQLSGK